MGDQEMSVIIPTCGKLDRLKLTLLSLSLQDVPLDSFEVIVVDDAADPATEEALAGLAEQMELKVVMGLGLGAAAAKNRAIPLSRGATLVFLDDDVICPRDFLREHRRMHIEARTESVVTAMRNHLYLEFSPQEEEWLRRCILGDFPQLVAKSHKDFHCQLLEKAYADGKAKCEAAWVCLNGCNFSAKRSIVLKANMFDDRLRYLEDTDMGLRLKNAGAEFFYSKKATNYHLEHATDIASRKAGWESSFPRFKESHGVVADIYELFFMGKISFEAFDQAYVQKSIPQKTDARCGSYWFWESLALRRWKTPS